MSMSAEMFKSDDWLGKYKKYSGDTGSTGLPGSLIQSTANLQSNFSLGNGMGKISSSNILNRSTLRFDQSMDNEYLMPGNANYKKPRKVIYESSDQDKVKIKIAKKNQSEREKQLSYEMDKLPIIKSSIKMNSVPLSPSIKK